MFEVESLVIEGGIVEKYTLSSEGNQLTFREVIQLWCEEADFRSFFVSVLKASAFETYRWETPSVTLQSQDKPFESVLINHPGLAAIPDRFTFKSYFTPLDKNAGIVAFDNLGRDAVLITASPKDENDVFNHLARFTRSASAAQNDALWRMVGEEMKKRVGASRVWLNTAGDGVSWVHIRLDDRPKYYRYVPYRV